jgi:hypothetical protein
MNPAGSCGGVVCGAVLGRVVICGGVLGSVELCGSELCAGVPTASILTACVLCDDVLDAAVICVGALCGSTASAAPLTTINPNVQTPPGQECAIFMTAPHRFHLWTTTSAALVGAI